MNALWHMLNAYFYELWDEYEYHSWEQAVDDFVRRSPEKARDVPPQIDQWLGTLDDAALRQALAEAGCAYAPEAGDRAWLCAVRDRIIAQR